LEAVNVTALSATANTHHAANLSLWRSVVRLNCSDDNTNNMGSKPDNEHGGAGSVGGSGGGGGNKKNGSLLTHTGAFNCGLKLPMACKPVTCGRYKPPLNASVLSAAWSPQRQFYYDASGSGSVLVVACSPGFYTSSTDAVQCSQSFEVSCSSQGQWAGDRQCIPLRCSISTLRTIHTHLPANHTHIDVAPSVSEGGQREGGGTFLAYQAEVSVGLGESVLVKCAQDYQRSLAGSIGAVCADACLFQTQVVACELFGGVCPRWDSFELGSGVQMKDNPYLMTLTTLQAFETQTLRCQPGFKLDNSSEAVTVAGLESLGPVRIKSSANFPPPDATSTTSLSLPLPGASIMIPPGAWPEGAGPLSVAVFDLREVCMSLVGKVGVCVWV